MDIIFAADFNLSSFYYEEKKYENVGLDGRLGLYGTVIMQAALLSGV